MARVQDRFTASQAKNQPFSDFTNDLVPHPVTGELIRFTGENAINVSIRNLLFTNTGERLFQPAIGGDIHKLLFEPMTSATGNLIKTMIEKTIRDYEPRAKVLQTIVNPDFDRNLYTVSIQYLIINRQAPVTLNVTLTRVR